MAVKDKILYLAKQLYPTGRAFRMPIFGVNEAMNKALALSEERAYLDGLSILDSILPDNNNFTAEDALLWEKRLFISVSSGASLDDRKLAILRKIQHPGDILARQHYLYIEGQLQAAGFDVYVHEYAGAAIPAGVYSDPVQFGQVQFGQVQFAQKPANIIANYSDELKDSLYTFGTTVNLRSSFYIGAATWPDKADVDADRKVEFRELILKLKPAQTAGYLLINYI